MAVRLGDVEFHAGPPVLGAPDDLDAVILSFLDAATTSLLIAVQEIDSEPIAEAILAAKARGSASRSSWRRATCTRTRRRTRGPSAGDNEVNRVIHAALLRAGIDVITDLNPAIFHQKFVVRDHGKPGAAVLTGSANFTRTDTGTNLATDPASPATTSTTSWCCAASRPPTSTCSEFDRLRAGTFGDLHERHEARPDEFRLGRHPGQAAVRAAARARDGDHEADAQGRARGSTSRCSPSPSPPASTTPWSAWSAPAWPSAAVLDRGQGAQRWAATQPLKAAGVELFENKAGHRGAQGAPQADGDRRPADHRRQLQLHRARDHPQRREHRRAGRPGGDRPGRRGRPAPSSPRTRSPRSTGSSPTWAGRSSYRAQSWPWLGGSTPASSQAARWWYFQSTGSWTLWVRALRQCRSRSYLLPSSWCRTSRTAPTPPRPPPRWRTPWPRPPPASPAPPPRRRPGPARSRRGRPPPRAAGPRPRGPGSPCGRSGAARAGRRAAVAAPARTASVDGRAFSRR